MVYQGAVTLSKKEQMRYSIVEKYRSGSCSRSEAALKLDLSVRQFSRLVEKVRERGFAGVVHGNVGRSPWNKKDSSLVDTYVSIYQQSYSNFNFQHALEMMELNEELEKISYSRFHKACRAKGIGKVKKRRANKARVARERFSQEGYMWQLDGSPDKWDGVEDSTLIALIDDATSKIPGAELHPSETTWACMNVVRKAIEENGKPEFILTDRAGWSSGSGRKRMHFSQFERACLELDITVIATPSPESKGRIERLNRTAQDRLIPELEFYGITGNRNCNQYIEDVFIPVWEEKFSVEPALDSNRYREVLPHVDLKEIFCIKCIRKVNRDHTISFGNRRYRIQPNAGENFKGKEITVHEYEDKTISINYGGRKLIFDELKKPTRRWI